MIFNFDEWILDIDLDATKELYEKNNYASNVQLNEQFISFLTEEQRDFFETLRVNPFKMNVEETIYDMGDLPMKMHRMNVEFVLCGNFVDIPDYQKNLYGNKDLFGDALPQHLHLEEVPAGCKVPSYRLGDFGVVFKHPSFKISTGFNVWECGYIVGSILVTKIF